MALSVPLLYFTVPSLAPAAMTIDHLLLPTDFSDAAEPVRHARLLADHFGAAIHVLHVADSVEQRRLVKADMDAFVQKHELGGATSAVVTAEAPAPGIEAYAGEHEIDLLVMGSHGRRGLGRRASIDFLGRALDFQALPSDLSRACG